MKRSRIALGLIAAAGLTGGVFGGLSSTTVGFESPDYTLGQIVGQHGWSAADLWINDNAAMVTDELACNGAQSLKFDGALLTDSCNPAARRFQMPAVAVQTEQSDSAYIEWNMLIRPPTGPLMTAAWAVEAHSGKGAPLAWAGLSGSTGEALLYAEGPAPIHTGVMIPFNTWCKMRLTIDLARTWTSLDVNGIRVASHPMPEDAGTGIDMLQVRIEKPAGGAMFVDNLSLVPLCKADFNGDGESTLQDFFTYLKLYFAGSFEADINHDSAVNVGDVYSFLAVWFIGCTTR